MSRAVPVYGGRSSPRVVAQAVVSDEDYERVVAAAEPRWRLVAAGYVATGQPRKGTFVLLHRFILGLGPGELGVDHRNGDRLDNRRENLRPATDSQNQANRHKVRGVSRHKGVTWYKRYGLWRARITVGDRERHLGYFDSEEAAAEAYNDAARACFGEFARASQRAVEAA